MANGVSEHGGYIRGATGRTDTLSPLDTGDARDAVVNNLNHIQDSSCQCVANVVGRAGGKASWDGVGSGADFARVLLLPPLPVCMRILPGGNTSRLVIRLDAQITAAGTATWRFGLVPFPMRSTAPPTPASVGATYVAEVSTTSTSIVELGPVSIYASGRDSGGGFGPGAWRPVPSRDGSGELGTVRQCMMQIEVWAKSTSAGIPRMSALTVHEWIV